MATGKSSSKRKSSSSSHKKKKSIKDSSEVKKRRSKSHRRNKSKKLRRRDASVSYSDEDSRRRTKEDSLSISSSDSEDDYRTRRARSRTRKDDKGITKKRVRRRSSSSSASEDNEDSPRRERRKNKKNKKRKVSKGNVDRKDSPSRKKEKGLKRKDESEGEKKKKKKTHQIKYPNERPRRDKSVDSVSSDSRSCSTYQDESSGSGERGFGRSRGRSVGKEKGKRSVSKTDIERDRYMYRSRSCSSGSDPSIYRGEDRLTSENYSRRLQSVLIDAKASKEAEGRYQSKDENKAEIIQDYDDYPSCRSNDSYDGGRKKDSSHHTHAVSEKKRKVDDLMVEEALTSKSRNTAFAQRSREDAGMQSVNSNPAKDVAEPTKMVTKTAIATGIGSSEVDDLETILRLKALENLKKFRGGLNTNTSALAIKNNVSDNAVMQPSTAKADSTKPQIRKEAGEIVVSAKNMVVNPIKRVSVPTVQRSPGVDTNMSALGIQKNASDNAVVKQPSTVKADTAKSHIREGAGHIVAASKDMVVQPMKNVSGPTMETNSAPKNNSRILNRYCKPSESKAQLNASTHLVMGAENSLPDQVVSGKTIERNSTNVDVITNKATNTSTLEQESPSDHSIFHQAPISPDIPKVKLLDSNNIADKNVVETAKAADGAHGAEVIKACESAALEASSYITPVTGEHGSNEPGDLAKGSSQFEQKTMSVMRGGELVQVSYKVYIPKKPPALARRKLQRLISCCLVEHPSTHSYIS